MNLPANGAGDVPDATERAWDERAWDERPWDERSLDELLGNVPNVFGTRRAVEWTHSLAVCRSSGAESVVGQFE